MNADAVLIGSIASVVIAVVIFGFLMVKIRRLMRKDAERNK